MRHRFQQLDRREKIIAGGVCLILLAAALYLYFGHQKDVKKNVRQGRPLVKVQTIVRQDMMRHIALSGQTVADANIALAPKYTGRITQVCVSLGDEVKAGQVLMI